MLKAKDFRRQAWGKLKGKWGTMALITLILMLIMGVCAGASIIGIGAIATLLITGPFMLGMANITLGIVRGKESVDVADLFSGFKNFLNAFVLYIINTILTALWSLLFVIPGIIKSYSYSMSYYILADNPDMAPNDARKRSMEMMHGNKWRAFCLDLSFIGWVLLSLLTFGILLFWIDPYMQTAKTEFYQSLLGEQAPADDGFEDEVHAEEAPAEDKTEENSEENKPE